MKVRKIIGCLTAALIFVVFTQQTKAQNSNADLVKNSRPSGDIYRTDIAERLPLEYPHLEERDVLWEKRIWREIDVRELQNHHFAYEKRHFVTILLDALKNNKISAYSTSNDEFTEELSYKDISKIINTCDTSFVTDSESGLVTEVPFTNEFDPKSILRYRIKEVVYFDSKLSRMNHRILGIAPIMNRYDNQNNLIGAVPLCWFYYNDLRNVLAKEPIFNSASDSRSLTWDDVFQIRYYSSFITKESNLKDARLQDLYSGINILYESEKIHENIRNREADMFSEGN
jgi:gliding motility associated protien GldN